MSKTTLIVECGVAETRAALIDNERAARFWFGPARGDEDTDRVARTGRRFAGRIRAVDKSLGAAFVDIGDGAAAYLPIKKSYRDKITQGALIAASVKSPPRQGKGAVLRYIGAADRSATDPGRLPSIEDAAIEAAKTIGEDVRTIIVDDSRARAALSAAGLKAEIFYEDKTAGLFESSGAAAELESVFDRCVEIPDGGRLIIDETQALTAIDVDTGDLKASSPARLREKIAIAAAFESARQIALRNIGGRIAIDFPTLETKSSRERFREKLRLALGGVDGAAAVGFSKSGLCSFTAPHRAQSLLERFTEPAPAEPLAGRRYTLDWRAKAAMRRLETRLRAAPRAKMRLLVGAVLGGYLNQRPAWSDRLRDRYGARFEIMTDETMEERGYDFSEQ